ncbi:MAG: DUF4760 domain-containing protein [Sphingomonas sp.]
MACAEVLNHAGKGTLVICEAGDGALQALGLAIAVLAIVVPILLYKLQDLANRRKATFDWITGPEASDEFLAAARVFSALRQSQGFDHLATPANQTARDERQSVLKVLNHYEITSLHIERGVLDESTYRKWMQSGFVRDWEAARTFVRRERWKSGTYCGEIFCHFELRARRWKPSIPPILEADGPPP